jgi:two-component system phosphate regulon response regulator PhoB
MPKIIIVDDNVQATTVLQRVLSSNGYEALVMNDSSKVAQRARFIFPDLFLLDLMTPEPDGFKLCRLLRADPLFTRTSIIIITALNDSDSYIVAFGAGANAYLTKPYDIKELLETVKVLLYHK